jgi:hypothetical protein
MRVRFQIAAIFVAVGLGALTVILLHEPMVLVPRSPYGRWILVRIPALSTLAVLALLLVLGDDRPAFGDTDDPWDPAMFWRGVGLAYLAGAVASATFVAVVALAEYLERVA